MATDQKTTELVQLLIYKGESLTGFEHLSSPNSTESELSRGRGASEVVDPDLVGESADISAPDDGDILRSQEGRIQIDSGYLMRFLEDRHTDLSPFDVLSLDSLASYPVPQPAIDTLPQTVSKPLEEQGYVRMSAVYDSESKRFYAAQRGWDLEPDDLEDPFERMMQLIDVADGSLPMAFDYFCLREGPEWMDSEYLHNVRDVKEHTIEDHRRKMERRVSESALQ